MCKGKLGFENGVSEAISEILKDGEKMSNLAAKFKDVADIYILGRGIHHPLAMEAALKLKACIHTCRRYSRRRAKAWSACAN